MELVSLVNHRTFDDLRQRFWDNNKKELDPEIIKQIKDTISNLSTPFGLRIKTLERRISGICHNINIDKKNKPDLNKLVIEIEQPIVGLRKKGNPKITKVVKKIRKRIPLLQLIRIECYKIPSYYKPLS